MFFLLRLNFADFKLTFSTKNAINKNIVQEKWWLI